MIALCGVAAWRARRRGERGSAGAEKAPSNSGYGRLESQVRTKAGAGRCDAYSVSTLEQFCERICHEEAGRPRSFCRS